MSRSSNMRRQHASDEDFTLAAWDTVMDLQQEVGGVARIELRPSERRGVWEVWSVVEIDTLTASPSVLCRLTGYYPNSRASAFSAALFAHLNTLSQMASLCFQHKQTEAERAK